jgi:ABC-type arginine/histidine transport system permease subunit
MYEERALVIGIALLGAVIAVAAALGRISGRLCERAAARLYYVSYGCTGLSIALFIVRGLLRPRP